MATTAITRPRGFRLTTRDLRLLRLISAHRFVLACHISASLGDLHRSVAYRRLHGLLELGFLAHERAFQEQPGCFRITPEGLEAIGSPLPPPTVDFGCWRHDAALVWQWLTAIRQVGELGAVLTERQMRHRDRCSSSFDGEPFALLTEPERAGRSRRRHYPDLVQLRSDGTRQALELELTQKSQPRLDAILIAYSTAAIETVVYLTDRAAIASNVRERAAALGLEGPVSIRLTHHPISATQPSGAWRPYDSRSREEQL